jgi:MFS transporter, OCT family, solute carrier family 22 (organic cation transporter), member 4/5
MIPYKQMVEKNIIDELIKKRVGAFGFWQQSTIFLASTLGLCYVLAPAFLNSIPPHFCQPSPEIKQQWDNISQQMNLSYESREYWQSFVHWYIPPSHNANETDGRQNYSACHHYVDPEEENFETRPCENGWIYLTEYSIFRKTVTEEFDLVCERRWLRSMDTAVYTGGMFTGYLLVGPLSDTYGRRITYLFMTSLVVCVNVVISLSNSYSLYMVFRFLIGLCCNAAYSSVYTLIGETSVSEYRPWITSMSFLAYSFIDRAIFLSLANAIQHWRWFYVSLGAVTSCSAIFIYFLPESPHWSLTHGRYEDVVDTLNFIASWNKWFRKRVALLKRIFSSSNEIREDDDAVITVENLFGEAENTLVSSMQRATILREENIILRTRDELLLSVRHAGMIKRCLGQAVLWIFMGMSYYGFTFSSEKLFETPYIGLIAVSFFGLPAYLIQAHVSNRFGRRNTILTSLIATDLLLTGLILFICFYHRDPVNLVYTTATAIIFCLTELICGVSTTYAMELFPTSLRNIGTAYLNALLCVAGGISVFVNNLEHYTGEKYAPIGVFLASGIFATGAVFILPETVNMPLPDQVTDIGQNNNTHNRRVYQ